MHNLCFSIHAFKIVLYTSQLRCCRYINRDINFVEYAVPSVLICVLYRWEKFFSRNFQTKTGFYVVLLVGCTYCHERCQRSSQVLNRQYPALIVLGFSLSLEYLLTTAFNCTLKFVCFVDVKAWLHHRFLGKTVWIGAWYRIIIFTCGLRTLALFLCDLFFVARHFTRESNYQ